MEVAMKIIKGALLALVAGALLAAPALRADDKPAQAEQKGHSWRGHGDKFDGMKQWLGLTDDQVAQWKKVETGQREAGKLLRDKLKAEQAQLAVLVDEKASDGKLTEALKALEADGKAMREQGQKQREAIQAILTPLQQAKLVLARQGKGGRGFGGWQKGHGGWQGRDGKACARKDAKDGGMKDGMDQADQPAAAGKN
jgi:Spy/CpxP family protein refolding chaperone